MYLRKTTSKKSKHPTYQIVEGYREGTKVKQRIIASLGVVKSPDDLKKLVKFSEDLIRKLEKEGLDTQSVVLEDLVHSETVYDGFGLVTAKLMEMAGFSEILRKHQGRHSFSIEEAIRLMITQRFDLPSSKKRTFERQQEHGFSDIDLHKLYRAMDAIKDLDEEIQKQTIKVAGKYSGSTDCFFFDVTTLYFESTLQDDLKDFGFSKDQKHHQVQIVFALVVNNDGLPLAYQIFKGNLSETKTLIPVLESLRDKYSIKNVVVVCDRGMASSSNVSALQDSGFQFIIAAKLRSMSKNLKINDLSFFKPLSEQTHPSADKVVFRTMPHPQYSNTQLIITYSPQRAKKDKADRERLLEKLQTKLEGKIPESSVKKVISNSGYKKFTKIKEGSLLTLNEKAIEEDKEWDGFHGIAVCNKAKLTVEQSLARYKELWHVEETFRVAKSTLCTRPMFHWQPDRIRSHILICFMTLFLERLLELLLYKNGTPLTPDRIRYALFKVHKVTFENAANSKKGNIFSSLSDESKAIYEVLNISTERKTANA